MEMKLRSAKDASSLDAQCWISSVTGFLNLQSAETQKTGLRRSESSGRRNGPDRLALMFILHSSMPLRRLSSGILSLSPYPTHSKEDPLVEMTKSVSPIISTPCMESKSKHEKLNNIFLGTVHINKMTYHCSFLWKFAHVCGKLLSAVNGNLKIFIVT